MKSTKKELQAYHPPKVTDYHAPQVMDYGNVKQITMALGGKGAKDGGKSPKHASQL